jgi:hypothetical protein
VKFTSIVLEYVLIGVQVLIWLSILCLLCFGDSWIAFVPAKEWSVQLSFLAIGAAYMLGIIFDRIASFIQFPGEVITGTTASTFGSGPDALSPIEMRMVILAKNPDVYREVDQRMRHTWLLRSSCINLSLILVFAALYAIIRRGQSWWLLLPMISVAVGACAIAAFSYQRAAGLMVRELFAAYNAVTGEHRTMR